MWEKIKDKMVEAESKASPVKKALIRWAKAAALEHQQKYITGQIPYGIEHGSIKYKLAHKLVLSKIHSALGLDRTLLWRGSRATGAAACSAATKRYYESLGLFLCDIYGATESTGPMFTNLEISEMCFFTFKWSSSSIRSFLIYRWKLQAKHRWKSLLRVQKQNIKPRPEKWRR